MESAFGAPEFVGMDLSGWRGVYAAPVLGEVSGQASMADPAYSPGHLLKRRRLSQLLEKLSVQLRNHNQYPFPRWLILETQAASTQAAHRDEPLDLSMKAEPPAEEKFACENCGQSFTSPDRLAKHVASRHRTRAQEATRAYECDVCGRRFARSDMLTRHARLHTGLKPYSCTSCNNVFSRSDHLATHLRTHTGEKPYTCSTCSYSACRRDMITRHMRIHDRRSQPA